MSIDLFIKDAELQNTQNLRYHFCHCKNIIFSYMQTMEDLVFTTLISIILLRIYYISEPYIIGHIYSEHLKVIVL